MTLHKFKDRSFANKTIASIVLLHFISLMMAARFNELWLNQTALYGTLVLYSIIIPVLWLWHRATGRITRVEQLDDIRNVFADGEQVYSYDPRKYFNHSKGLFTGLSERTLKPFYIPWSDYRSTHMQVLGSTGFGKGVAAAMFLSQSLQAGETVVVIDPKNDKFAPNVLYQVARECGAPFYLIDLTPDKPAQINIFRDCSAADIEEILNTAFDMAEKGDVADFYRLFDRKAAADVCAIATAAKRSPTLRDLVAATYQSKHIDVEDKKAVKFQADLEELAKLQAINAAEGHDLAQILSQRAVVYVIGSTRKVQTVRAQKMLLLRLLQIMENRDSIRMRPVAMMLDELKYLLSTAVLQALGTVRDKGCHIILAHQSNDDLKDCGGLDPNAVRGAVIVNTGLKLIYRSSDPQTLQWASDLSGTIVAKQQSSHMSQAMFESAEGHYRDVERNYITKNEILAMPKQTGMLYGAGLATIIKVSPLPAGARPKIVPALSASAHSAQRDSDPFTKAASSATNQNSEENVP
ncbi:MAG TPA: type IV secretory system conjugative DNA transfer family protein [Candidatus Angelobacter sp.]|nr:type IV secretory system conjugative DNA transfer family protein [Candidatus Angelobacter sp.]